MSEELQFRVMAPLQDAWDTLPLATDSLYPDERMGEVRSTYRYSVYVTGRRSYIVVIRLAPESASTTILLTVIINPRPIYNNRSQGQVPAD